MWCKVPHLFLVFQKMFFFTSQKINVKIVTLIYDPVMLRGTLTPQPFFPLRVRGS